MRSALKVELNLFKKRLADTVIEFEQTIKKSNILRSYIFSYINKICIIHLYLTYAL